MYIRTLLIRRDNSHYKICVVNLFPLTIITIVEDIEMTKKTVEQDI